MKVFRLLVLFDFLVDLRLNLVWRKSGPVTKFEDVLLVLPWSQFPPPRVFSTTISLDISSYGGRS